VDRPELQNPPEIYYDQTEAKKYAINSRMLEIQTQMTVRAIELLNLPNKPCYLLDLGCGSGLSGEVLTQQGHYWVGVDISASMLGVAKEREVEGDMISADMGDGLFFRPGVFDGAISISALQWLCNADTKAQNPHKRIHKFFRSLYSALTRGARAVFQFYPLNNDQVTMLTSAAMKAGFGGGLVVDYPNSTKAKKIFLCLFAGEPSKHKLPKGLGSESMTDDDPQDSDDKDAEAKTDGESKDKETKDKETKDNETKGNESKNTTNDFVFAPPKGTVLFTVSPGPQQKREKKKKRLPVKSRAWVLKKKERMRRLGRDVPKDTKYTGRKRRPKF